MGWTFPDNHISINARISFGAAWNDVDLGTNNDVPSGTVAVILKIRNTGGSNRASVRPNGNTAYTYTNALATNSINYLIVKLDANRVFEGFFASDYLMVVVVGYTDSDTLFQNFVNKSLTTTGSYQTEDVSGDGVPAGASVAVVNIIQTAISAAYNFALRPIGASYDYYKAWSYNAAAGYAPSTYWPVGLDANRQFEHKITNVAVDAYLWGYFGSERVMLSTPVSKAPGSTGWQDIDVSADVPSNAIAAIFQVVGGATGTYGVNFRKNGSTDNLTTSISMSYLHHLVHWVGLDANKICECYQSTTGFYVYLVGYVIPPSGSYTLSAGSGSYDESGIAQTLKKTSLLTLAVGSYVETGTAATLKWGRKVDATTAAFSVIGTVASLERGDKVNLGTTFFSITGTVASLKRGYRVDIGSTLFAITGTAASLKRGYKVDVGSALFSVTGTVAGLFRGYKVAAGSGSVSYTGPKGTPRKNHAAQENDC